MGSDECSRELEFKMWAGGVWWVKKRVHQFGKIGYVEVD